MKKITKTIVTYVCGVCGKNYKTEKQALSCEVRPIENPAWKIDDRVTWREKRQCANSNRKPYILNGKVIGLHEPQLVDEEYNRKWLGGALTGKHVHMYEVAWTCPHCQQKCYGLFYGMELKKI